mmetsp:Transcript_71291/g.123728  ORF Transcript_71291/g.123728 Transcript_71291/m.123728 type:complete len:202 (-) Transcript_71291:855-1460(-)
MMPVLQASSGVSLGRLLGLIPAFSHACARRLAKPLSGATALTNASTSMCMTWKGGFRACRPSSTCLRFCAGHTSDTVRPFKPVNNGSTCLRRAACAVSNVTACTSFRSHWSWSKGTLLNVLSKASPMALGMVSTSSISENSTPLCAASRADGSRPSSSSPSSSSSSSLTSSSSGLSSLSPGASSLSPGAEHNFMTISPAAA